MRGTLSSEELLALAQEACLDATKRVAAIDGVTVHSAVTVIVDITANIFQPGDNRATREKIYQTQMELMDAHPGVLFDFKVRR